MDGAKNKNDKEGMSMEAAGTFVIVLTLVGLVFGIMLVVAPLAIWHHVAKLQKEAEKTNRLLRAQYDVMAKLLEVCSR